MEVTVDRKELVDLLQRAQQFASTISIYSGRDLVELSLYRLEAESLRDKIHEYVEIYLTYPKNPKNNEQ